MKSPFRFLLARLSALLRLLEKPGQRLPRFTPRLRLLEERTVPAVYTVSSGPSGMSLATAVQLAEANNDASNTIDLAPGAYSLAGLSLAAPATQTLTLAGAGPGVSIAATGSDVSIQGKVNLDKLSLSGNTVVSGGTLTTGAGTSISNLTLVGGVVQVDASLSLGSLAISGGTLTGPGTATVSGSTSWTGGTLSGTGGTILNGPVYLGAADGKAHTETLDGRAMTFEGTLLEAGFGTLDTLDQPTVTLPADAPLSISSAPGAFSIAYQDNTINGLDPVFTRSYNSSGILVELAASVDHSDGSSTYYAWYYNNKGGPSEVDQETKNADGSWVTDVWYYYSNGELSEVGESKGPSNGVLSTSEYWYYFSNGSLSGVETRTNTTSISTTDDWGYNTDGSLSYFSEDVGNVNGDNNYQEWDYTSGSLSTIYKYLSHGTSPPTTTEIWSYHGGSLTEAQQTLVNPDGSTNTNKWFYKSGVLTQADAAANYADGSSTSYEWDYSNGALSDIIDSPGNADGTSEFYEWGYYPDGNSRSVTAATNNSNGSQNTYDTWSLSDTGSIVAASAATYGSSGKFYAWQFYTDATSGTLTEETESIGYPDNSSTYYAWYYPIGGVTFVSETSYSSPGVQSGYASWSQVDGDLAQAPVPDQPSAPPPLIAPSAPTSTAPSAPNAPGITPPDDTLTAPSAPTDYVVLSTPSNVTADTAFDVTATVYTTLDDTIDTTYTGNITISLATDPNGNTTLGGTTQLDITSGSGGADFSDLTLDQAGQGFVLQASGNAVPAAKTGSFDVQGGYTWTGKGSDDLWSNGDNWSGGLAPSAGDALVFPAGAVQLTTDDDLGGTYSSIAVLDSYTFTGSSFVVSGDLDFQSGSSELDCSATVDGNTFVAGGADLTIANDATLDDAPAIKGKVTVDPGSSLILNGDGSIAASGTVDVQGKLSIPSGANTTVDGVIDVEGQGELDDDGILTVGAEGTCTNDSTLKVNGDGTLNIANQGQCIEGAGSTTTYNGNVNIAPTGNLTAGYNSTTTTGKGSTVTNSGNLTVAKGGNWTADAGSTTTNTDGSHLMLYGSFAGKYGSIYGASANADLTTGQDTHITAAGTWTQNGPTTLNAQANFEVAPQGTATFGASVTNNGGKIKVDANASATFKSTLINVNGGVDVFNGKVQQAQVSVFKDLDAITVGTDGELDLYGTLTEGAGGSLTTDGAVVVESGATLDNQSTVVIAPGGSLTIAGSGAMEAGSTLDDFGALTVPSGGRLDDSGTVVKEPGSTYTNTGSATVGAGGRLVTGGLGTPAFTSSGAVTILLGTTTTAITGQLTGGIPAGESVQITLDGVTQSATLDANGNFSTTFDTSGLDVADSPYPLSLGYGGDATFFGAFENTTLTVANPTTPTFTGPTTPAITYGTGSTTISAQLGGTFGGLGVPAGETVNVTLDGVTRNAAIGVNDSFSTTFDTSTLAASATPYTIGFSYVGDADFTAATGSSTLTVSRATPSFSGLSSPTITYGTGSTTISGQLNGVPAGETVNVTLAGVTQTATIGVNGSFSTTFGASTLAVSATPYSIGFSYAGDTDFTSTTGSSTLTVNPGPVSLSKTSVTLGLASVQLGGATTITLQAVDAYGNKITTGGLSVAFKLGSTTGAQGTIGGVTDNGNGTYTATFTGKVAPAAANTIVATIGGSPVSQSPSIRVTGAAVSLSKSLVTLSPVSVAPGSSTTVTFQAESSTAKETSGGLVVAFKLGSTSGGQGAFSAVKDNGNGTYTASFTGTVPGTNTITATVGGVAITSRAAVTVTPPPVSPANSTYQPILSNIQLGGVTTITLQAVDVNGNKMSSGGLIVVFKLGSTVGGKGTFGTVTDHKNGTYTATFTGTIDGTNTIVATIGGQTVTSKVPTITVSGAAVSLAKSFVALAPSSIPLNGTTTVTLQAEDAAGKKETGGGLTVAFKLASTSGGKGSFGKVTDNGNGTYTVVFTGTTAGSNLIEATIGGKALTSAGAAIIVL
jgi:adhesin/invasin